MLLPTDETGAAGTAGVLRCGGRDYTAKDAEAKEEEKKQSARRGMQFKRK